MDAQLINILIIDKEEDSQQSLAKLISQQSHNMHIVGKTMDVLEGLQLVFQKQPDVVFLDIEIPNYSGLKIIEKFTQCKHGNDAIKGIDFELVVVTTNDEYALQVHKSDVLGFMLKPFQSSDLADVFEKISLKRFRHTSSQIYEAKYPKTQKLVFPTLKGLLYLYAEEICYMESAGRYTYINMLDNQQFTCTLNLRDSMDKLANSTFIRVHRSFVINLMHIRNYFKGRDNYILMDNKARVEVGLQYKEDLNRALECFLK